MYYKRVQYEKKHLDDRMESINENNIERGIWWHTYIYILHDTDITVYLITCMKIKKIRELNGNRDDDITLC